MNANVWKMCDSKGCKINQPLFSQLIEKKCHQIIKLKKLQKPDVWHSDIYFSEFID